MTHDSHIYLIKFSKEKHIVIIHEVVNFNVSQTMHDENNKISNAVHAFLAYEENLSRALVEEGIPERVLGVIVGRQGGSDE